MGRKTRQTTKASEARHRAAMTYTVSQLTALNDLDLLVEQKVAQVLARQSPNSREHDSGGIRTPRQRLS